METRRELIEALGERYRRSERVEKKKILDEFVELAGYHRKHAIRVLKCERGIKGSTPRVATLPVRRSGHHGTHDYLGSCRSDLWQTAQSRAGNLRRIDGAKWTPPPGFVCEGAAPADERRNYRSLVATGPCCRQARPA